MFVPGHNRRMVEKAQGTDVDAIMLDIEDGVLPEFKPQAREVIAEALTKPAPAGAPVRFVRMNAVGQPDALRDLDAAVGPNLDGLVVAKVECPEDLHRLDGMVSLLEHQRNVPSGQIRFLVALESANALLNARAIASACPRTMGMILGTEDYARDIGLPVVRTHEASDLIFARSQFVNAATAAGVQSVDGVWPDLNNDDELIADSTRARRLGFTGKSLIHPKQIEVVNRVFSPTAEEVDFAERVLAAFKDAEAKGMGAVAFGGQLLDKPIVDRARAVVELHTAKSKGAT